MILVNIYINDSEYNYNKNFIIQGGKEEKQKGKQDKKTSGRKNQ